MEDDEQPNRKSLKCTGSWAIPNKPLLSLIVPMGLEGLSDWLTQNGAHFPSFYRKSAEVPEKRSRRKVFPLRQFRKGEALCLWLAL